MKKIIIILLAFLTFASYGQAEFEKVAIKENVETASTSKIVSQQPGTGELNYINATALPISTPTQNALNLKENVANKQNSLAIDGTGTKYPTVDAVNSALPKTYTTTVYVDTNDPNIATIFDDENPPTVNDDGLKSNTDNLYIGADASAWVYNGITYVTKIVPATSNFYINSTSIDAGNSKDVDINRIGAISTSRYIAAGSGLVSRLGSSNIENLGSYLRLANKAGSENNQFQLNASNGVDLWNYSSGIWNKRFTFSSGGNFTATSAAFSSFVDLLGFVATGNNFVSNTGGVFFNGYNNFHSGIFSNNSGTGLSFQTGGSVALGILSSGAATFSSTVTATSFIKSGGTSSQFLKADGSVDSSVYAPISGSANYIQNQNTSAQSADMWISGSATIGTNMFAESILGLNYSSGSSDGEINLFGGATNKGGEIILSGGSAAGNIVFKTGNGAGSQPTALTLNADKSATFASTVTATSFIKSGGTSSQFLKADGSVDSSVYATLSSPSLTGIPTAPTAVPGTNTTQIATTAFVQANTRPYKVYTAILTQTGTSAPTAIILENTLGGTITWSRSGVGLFIGTLTGAFTTSKTCFLATLGIVPTSGGSIISITRTSMDTILIRTTNSSGSVTDGILDNALIEIRVYN